MEYTQKYNELKSLFSPEKDEISIPGSGIKIFNTPFQSDFQSDCFFNIADKQITENLSFTYPVFAPANPASGKVILLLHGLNERSWVKYLVWAYWLAENTGSYVVLFPISFHINRSPAAWKDPRAMIPFMKERNLATSGVNMSSFANAAISSRLVEDPLRFFNSGYQTITDLIKLVSAVRNGTHQIIPKSNQIDIFAYSIGAFLSEIVLMGNPSNLFTGTKLFIFCGGSVFSNMQGASKLIMDSQAFKKVYNYYLFEFEKSITGKNPLADFLKSSQVGMAFRSMIDLGRLKNFREGILKKIRNQIHTITLVRDTVIPSAGVVATLNTNKNTRVAEVWDFPYAYTHENPFPVLALPLSKDVDISFNRLFSAAGSFFK